MIFTVQDIQNLFGIIEYRIARVIADVLGKEFLSPDDERVLKENGFDWTKELKRIPTYWQSFLFGRLSSILTPQQLLKLDYTDLNKYIERKQYKQPNKREMAEYRAAAVNTYSYIKGMGNKVKDTLSGAISQEELKTSIKEREEEVRQGIKEEIERGVLEKRSVQNIVSNLGHRLDEWNRDWGRIVETEMQNIYLLGKAQTIMEDYGPNARVYKHTFEGACKFCIKFYTTQGIGSQPRIFKLNELIENGSNIGRKQVDWEPTLGPVHPFCYDDETEVLTNEGWKLFKDLNKTEKFLSIDLETGSAEWIKAIRWIDEEYEGPMILREYKGFSLQTTPNHFHVIKNKCYDNSLKKTIETAWSLVSEDQIRRNSYFLRTIPNWIGKEVSYFEFDGHKYDSKLFCQFMGYFVSEGSVIEYINEERHVRSRRIHIAQSKEKYLDKIFDCCSKLFDHLNKCSNYVEIRIPKEEYELYDYLKQLGHADQKYIPSNIKELNKECIEIFLDSFREGDGTIRKGSNWGKYKCRDQRIFTTSSKQLEADLCELILKIGKRPYYRNAGKSVVYDKRYDRIYTAKNDQYVIEECQRVVSCETNLNTRSVNYEGRIYDVELEKNHTLIVRRNGFLTVSGNCRCELHYIPEGYVWDEETKQFQPPKEYKRKVERKSKVKIQVGDKTFEV